MGKSEDKSSKQPDFRPFTGKSWKPATEPSTKDWTDRGIDILSDKFIRGGWHWSFGFLRRSELDDKDGYRGFCYEAPDGDMFYSQREDHRLMCFLVEYEDRQTGEIYLTLDPRSTRDCVVQFWAKTA